MQNGGKSVYFQKISIRSRAEFRIQAGAGTGRVALGGGTVRSPGTPQVIIRGTDQ